MVYTPGLSEHRGSASKFYYGDALGSTRGITDSTQAVTDSVLYDAFSNTITRTGTTPTPFGFVGKAQYQSDSDSGLQLLGDRYYDPSIGRFLSSDPAKAGTTLASSHSRIQIDHYMCYLDNFVVAKTLDWPTLRQATWETKRKANPFAWKSSRLQLCVSQIIWISPYFQGND